MADFFSGLEDIGGAVSDLFGAKGSQKAGDAYGKAASIATQNEAITLRSGSIQQQQENQNIVQAIGGEEASVAGAGFTGGGSAGDLLRMSAQKGALNKQLLANQTEITAQGFDQQAQAYKGQQETSQMTADAQKASGASKGLGGILQIGASLLSLF